MKLATIVLALSVTACSSVPCYFEVGTGVFTRADHLAGNNPSQINAYCEKENFMGGDLQYGIYHDSDMLLGKPFNNMNETSTEKVMVKYRKRIN